MPGAAAVSTCAKARTRAGLAAEAGAGRGLALAAAMLALSLMLVPLTAVRLPAPGAEVALVFAPGIGRDAALAAVAEAGGLPVRAGAAESVLVARFPRALDWPEVWSLGALAALDPLAFGGCLVGPALSNGESDR